jgi:hypothetical protein
VDFARRRIKNNLYGEMAFKVNNPKGSIMVNSEQITEDLQTIALALSLSKRHLSGESAQKVDAAMARIKAELTNNTKEAV